MTKKNQKILMFVEDVYEDTELHYPRYRMQEAGFEVIVAGPEAQKKYKGKHGVPITADIAIDDVKESEFVGLIIPGGYAPDKLRVLPKVLELTKQFHQNKKLLAFICHAGWVPASAEILKGIKCTSYHTIKDDLVNAGAKWVDQAVVEDGHIISSRKPDDLPIFCATILKFLNC